MTPAIGTYVSACLSGTNRRRKGIIIEQHGEQVKLKGNRREFTCRASSVQPAFPLLSSTDTRIQETRKQLAANGKLKK